MGVASRQLTCAEVALLGAVFLSRPLLGGSTTAFHSWPQPATQTRARPNKAQQKMCRKTEDAGETLGQEDNHAGGCQKSCHFDQVRLQREPEQPYCGICQAYVEKCVCKEPRPL